MFLNAGKLIKTILLPVFLAIFLALVHSPAAFAISIPVQFSASEVELEDFLFSEVTLHNQGGGLRLEAGQLRVGSQPHLALEGLRLSCKTLVGPGGAFCPDGDWQVQLRSRKDGWSENIRGTISEFSSEAGWLLKSSLKLGEFDASLLVTGKKESTTADVHWSRQDIRKLPFAPLWPDAMDWIKSGSSQGSMNVLQMSQSESQTAAGSQDALLVRFELGLQGISLDSPEGLYAAEGLALEARGSWTPPSPGTTGNGLVELQASFLTGEVLLDQFYTSFGPQQLQLETRILLEDKSINISKIRLNDESVLDLQASAKFSPEDPLNSLQYQVRKLDMKFPAAYTQYLEPILASWTLDKLVVTGGLVWSGSGEGTEFPSGTLQFDDLSVVDKARQRFAFTGMKAHIEVGQSQGLSDFSWQGLLLGKINLGAGEIALKTAPGLFELASPLKLQMLGGEFSIDDFSLKLPPAGSEDMEPEVGFQAGLKDLDMEQLSKALDWPPFDGKISGRIPGASFDDGVLTVDGLLSFEAFDGQILLSDLRVERLFGVLPSFAASLEVVNLDLQLLTHTFSFGQIAGRLDGYVRELRMLDWSPVSFDAWFGTPESQSRSRQISRQAVNHLTSIGGGGATAALTGPLMRMFNNFSYSRLGMGCKLENYVCTIRGLNDEPDSVLIMEGSGVPKLSIRVFNRRMDWPQLVSNLSAATSGESIRIGDP